MNRHKNHLCRLQPDILQGQHPGNNMMEEEPNMRISELLNLNAIDVNAAAASKADAIDYMTRLMEKSGNLNVNALLGLAQRYASDSNSPQMPY